MYKFCVFNIYHNDCSKHYGIASLARRVDLKCSHCQKKRKEGRMKEGRKKMVTM
jgi:hypothetical protein